MAVQFISPAAASDLVMGLGFSIKSFFFFFRAIYFLAGKSIPVIYPKEMMHFNIKAKRGHLEGLSLSVNSFQRGGKWHSVSLAQQVLIFFRHKHCYWNNFVA